MEKDKNKVIFFDVGGTLIRTANPVGETYAMVAKHYGVSVDFQQLHQGFVAAWLEMKPRDPIQGARVLDDREWWKQVVRKSWKFQPLPENFPFDAYFDEVYQLFERPELWRIFPETESVLEQLRKKKIRCGVLSNWDRRLRTILKSLELDHYFEHLLISSELGVEKPHVDMFRQAEKCFGIKSEQAILIGDEERFDKVGGEGAGWEVFIVQRPEYDLRDILNEIESS